MSDDEELIPASQVAELRSVLTQVDTVEDAEMLCRAFFAARRLSADSEPNTATEWLARCREFELTDSARKLTTGTPLDDTLDGVYPGELVLVLGRWGTAKTTFGAHVAKEVLCQNQAVLYLSLEVPGVQMYQRFMQALLGATLNRVREQLASGDDTMDEHATMLDKCGFYMADKHAIDVEAIGQEIDKAEAKLGRKVGVVVVDHADYVQSAGRIGGKNEAEVIRERYVRMKSLAKSADVVIMSLHQGRDTGEWYESPTSRSSKGPVECADVAIGLLRDRAEDSPDLYMELIKSRRSTLTQTVMRFLGPCQQLMKMEYQERSSLMESFRSLRGTD